MATPEKFTLADSRRANDTIPCPFPSAEMTGASGRRAHARELPRHGDFRDWIFGEGNADCIADAVHQRAPIPTADLRRTSSPAPASVTPMERIRFETFLIKARGEHTAGPSIATRGFRGLEAHHHLDRSFHIRTRKRYSIALSTMPSAVSP